MYIKGGLKMNTVPYIRRWAEQWWDWKEVQEYAKDKDMEWSEQQCKDFLEEHEEEISMALREVGDDLIDNWLYDIKSDLDDAEEI
tara:strand:- start:10 stop:264 length:255 start_codon:yes stop_codon:yes gene_type:complete